MSIFFADLRYAWRTLRAAPAFTAVAIGSLALGIGANAAAFSIVSAMLLRPLPVQEPERLVAVFGQREGAPPGAISYPTLRDLRRLDVFQSIASHTGTQFAMRDGGRPEMVWGELVAANYFATVGARPVLGRGFLEPAAGAEPEAPAIVLSHSLWQRRFAADPGVLGRTVRLNGLPYEIVGVAPEGFVGTRLFSFTPDLFLPLESVAVGDSGLAAALESRESEWMLTIARLRSGVTLQEAQGAVAALAAALARDHPDTHEGLELRVYENRAPINPWILPPERLRQMAALITLAMLLVLLLACANVANLLLARAAGRGREIAVRLSIGSSRGRLVRQLLTESLLLAVLGGGLGLLLGYWIVDASSALRPTLDFETTFELRVDGRVLTFTAVASVLSAVAFGLLPALQASRPALVAALKDEARGSSARGSRVSEVLVAGQVALSLVLLVGAGLFMRSFRAAQEIDPGFEIGEALVAGIDLGPLDYEEPARRELHERLRQRLLELPGVRSAALASALPLDSYASSAIVEVPGRERRARGERQEVFYSVVSAGYFETLRTPLVSGRGIEQRDGADAPRVAVVNETMARRMWPGEEPLGKRFSTSREEPPLEVVGVAKDGKYLTIGEEARPYFFVSLAQNPVARFRPVLRTDGDPLALAPALRRAVAELDPELPVFGVKSLEQQMETPLSGPESGAATVGFFGILALLLAASGIYGVVSYAVARRTREIGIRMALGARKAQVLRLVLGRGARLAAAGMVVGLAGSLLLARGLTGLLLGVSGTDPLTYAAISLLLGSVALFASWVPAIRAARVDPLVALRHE